ncbi:hypothetical protein ABZ260_33335, partial [Streptosporangium sp. NPDC006013]|uniref:hypothetical protein n=1 Tax=Streptosporangium sp. NPDC006013 TaxID=3155596 RepID=UPI0033A7C615
APSFHTRRDKPPTSSLRPIIPDNACALRITAAPADTWVEVTGIWIPQTFGKMTTGVIYPQLTGKSLTRIESPDEQYE